MDKYEHLGQLPSERVILRCLQAVEAANAGSRGVGLYRPSSLVSVIDYYNEEQCLPGYGFLGVEDSGIFQGANAIANKEQEPGKQGQVGNCTGAYDH